MTLFRKYFKGFVTSSILLFCFFSSLTGQATAEVLDHSSDEVVIKIENTNEKEKPDKILLVYDSTLITLESTATSYNTLNRTNTNTLYFSSLNSMEALLAEEIEKDVEVEKWMLKPFKTQFNFENAFKTDKEEDTPLEAWMSDLSKW